MSSEVEGVHFVKSAKPGKPIAWYIYAWRGGPRVAKHVGANRPKLTKEYLGLIAEASAAQSACAPGTIIWLSRQWRSLDPENRAHSPEWEALGDGTKKLWGGYLDAIEAKWGKTPLRVWNDPRMVAKVMQWRDARSDTPRAADIGVQVLRELLEFGRLRGLLTINVAVGIPTLYRGGDRAEIIWTADEIDRFCVAAVALNRPNLIDAIWLGALTGLRRQDLATLTWAQVGEFAIVKKALKRSARKRRFARMPRIPELDALLEELRGRYRKPGVETVLVNSQGEPWSIEGLGGSFVTVRKFAGIVHLDEEGGKPKAKHLHDVRGTFVTKLCIGTDLTDKEIADVMAWSPEKVATIRRMYVDQSAVIVALGERIARAV